MDLGDMLVLAGVGLVVIGLLLIALPAGVIGAGAGLIAVAYLMGDS